MFYLFIKKKKKNNALQSQSLALKKAYTVLLVKEIAEKCSTLTFYCLTNIKKKEQAFSFKGLFCLSVTSNAQHCKN